MKLTDFDNKTYAHKALRENYGVSFDVSNMSITNTKAMLKKVRGLAMEAKASPEFYQMQADPAYMKLVFMEQALVSHHNELSSRPQPRIVFENEEVEKSQVVLAAQDMVDSVQKMVEQVSDMLVKELPALGDSVTSEIGVNEGEQFSSQATEALTSLTAALSQAKVALQGALNVVTGQGGGDAFGAEAPDSEEDLAGDMAAGDEMGDEMGAGMGDEMGAELPPEELPAEEPEELSLGNVGRAKR